MSRLQSFFSTPARQALGWTGLGLLGILFAALGVWFLTDDGGSGTRVADAGDEAVLATPTATPTAQRSATQQSSPSATATATTSPTETATPTTVPTTRPAVSTGGGGNAANPEPQAPEPTPTPEPTPPPAVASGPYCDNPSSNSPPNSVIGLLKSAGADVPAGASVSLAFDGVVGPTRATTAAGGYRVDYFAAGEGCANRVGASIAVVYNGVFYPTGQTVGGSPGVPVRLDIAE